MLPGVGAFAPAMKRLRESGLVEPLQERVGQGGPTLAICLGLQLLGRASEESPGTEGLGIIDSCATRFDGPVRVPQMGWNLVEPERGFEAALAGHAYFANSYRLVTRPAGWSAAWSTHGGRFVAAIQRGSVVACQFHPELSGAYGRDLLRSWLGLPVQEPTPC
ncbi:MAG: imidazole glycerol phosphate synthase subunit HisH [Planctomycetaceae bacterium]|nr:imidazole glycerol phosphate synthase subunit HisH [Planctomycetaceae bacterium]